MSPAQGAADDGAAQVPVLGVLVGSTRPARVGRRLADQIGELARLRSEATVRVVDLAEIALPFLDEPKLPARGDYEHAHTLAWKQTVDALDAILVVSPEYNAGYPAPLKNAIDTLYAEWAGKPILLVTYGSSGGRSAAAQLATVFGRIKAALVSPSVAISISRSDVDGQGQLVDPCTLVERHRADLEVGFAAIHTALGC